MGSVWVWGGGGFDDPFVLKVPLLGGIPITTTRSSAARSSRDY